MLYLSSSASEVRVHGRESRVMAGISRTSGWEDGFWLRIPGENNLLYCTEPWHCPVTPLHLPCE